MIAAPSNPLHPMPPAATGPAVAPVDSATALGAVDWLCLLATPTFAIMALISALTGGTDMTCMGMQDASPLSGMAVMYGLMSVFHLAPWVRVIAGRRG